MKKIILILFISFTSQFTIAQTSLLWGNLNCPLSYFPQRMYYDTLQNTLFVSAFDSSTVWFIGKYDGTNWTTMELTNSNNFINYNGNILVGAPSYPSVLKWNGTTWIPFDTVTPNGGVMNFLQISSDLYACGTFNTVGTITAHSLAKWNGTTWSNVGNFPYSPSFGTNYVNAMAYYNGTLYAGGNFEDNTGNVMNIASWDGTQWNQVGTGIHGGTDQIADMIVYNNELYVAGSFKQSHGNAGNYIQKWNGINWSDVGGGVIGAGGGNGQIFDLEVFNNNLYAVGDFDTAGGIPALHLAKWNGTNWCSLGTELQFAQCLTKSNTDLYVGNFFKTILVDTTGSIVKWIGGNFTDSCTTTGINEIQDFNKINIYPNPSTDIFIISSTEKIKTISIKNILGEEIKTFTNSTNIDLTGYTRGIYFAEIKTEKGITRKKIILQ